MNILIACETSGEVRDAFIRHGFHAMSCDILPHDSGSNKNHIQGNVLDYLDYNWSLIIAHPPCTYMCSSGLHWNKRVEGRQAKTEDALLFVQAIMNAPCKHIAIENPVGCIGTRIRKADQYIHPHQFGHDASKKTGLWLKNIPLLEGTQDIEPRIIDGKPRWANQTDSGQNRLGPSEGRWKERSKTYHGIAEAMANQWGRHILL